MARRRGTPSRERKVGIMIDRIASAMTDVEPSSDFRARVMAKLPSPRPARWPRMVLPIAAAIASVALWLPRVVDVHSSLPDTIAGHRQLARPLQNLTTGDLTEC